jgi:hypothetical protein
MRPRVSLSAALATLALFCSCTRGLYRPPQGFAPRSPVRPEIGLVLVVEGAVKESEIAEASLGFESGVVSSFQARGYHPVIVERIARIVTDEQIQDSTLDAREQVLFDRSMVVPKARATRLETVAIVRFLVRRVHTPADAPSVTLRSGTLEGHANYYGWSNNQLVFFSEVQTDANWMPLVGTMDAHRSHGAWFSYPPKAWARSVGRRLLRQLPARGPLRPERTSPAGFPIPAPRGYTEVPGIERDLAPELPGSETRFRTFQDAIGNAFSVLSTNRVTWGWEVVPRHGDAYLLVDPKCSFRPTEIWPTTAEAPVPVPACVPRR